MIEGASAAAAGKSIEVISDLRYCIDQLQRALLWRESNFRKKDGKPYADALQMRALDVLLTHKGLSITGRPPAGDEVHELHNLKLWAKEIAQNNGRSPDEWGL